MGRRRNEDVVIIGPGIVGVAVAFALTKRALLLRRAETTIRIPSESPRLTQSSSWTRASTRDFARLNGASSCCVTG
jgi:glycine/D-amino acid oxidase-like deaminating enzyme